MRRFLIALLSVLIFGIPATPRAEFLTDFRTACNLDMRSYPTGRLGEFMCPFGFLYGHSKTSVVYACEGFLRLTRAEGKPQNKQTEGRCYLALPMFNKSGTYTIAGKSQYIPTSPVGSPAAIGPIAVAVDEEHFTARACVRLVGGFFDTTDPLCVDMILPK